MKTKIEVTRENENRVFMFPGTMEHVKKATNTFGRSFNVESYVDDSETTKYIISFGSADPLEVNEVEDFMNDLKEAKEEGYPLIEELKSINDYFKSRINFSLLDEVNNFDMESIDEAASHLRAIHKNSEALNKVLRNIQEVFASIALAEEANSK